VRTEKLKKDLLFLSPLLTSNNILCGVFITMYCIVWCIMYRIVEIQRFGCNTIIELVCSFVPRCGWCRGAATSFQPIHGCTSESRQEDAWSGCCCCVGSQHDQRATAAAATDVFRADDAECRAASADCRRRPVILPAAVRVTGADAEEPDAASADAACCRTTTHTGHLLSHLPVYDLFLFQQMKGQLEPQC